MSDASIVQDINTVQDSPEDGYREMCKPMAGSIYQDKNRVKAGTTIITPSRLYNAKCKNMTELLINNSYLSGCFVICKKFLNPMHLLMLEQMMAEYKVLLTPAIDDEDKKDKQRKLKKTPKNKKNEYQVKLKPMPVEEETIFALKFYEETDAYITIPRFLALQLWGHDVLKHSLDPARRNFIRENLLITGKPLVHTGDSVTVRFAGKFLTEPFDQLEIVKQIIYQLQNPDKGPPGGKVCIACGGGKTFLGLAAYAFLQTDPRILPVSPDYPLQTKRTLFVSHNNYLVSQTFGSICRFLPGLRVGIMTEGKMPNPLQCDFVLSLIQTLASLPDAQLDAFLSHFGLVIFDECHHYPTHVYSRVVARCASLGILGLTATPRASGKSYILDYLFGPTIVQEDRPPQSAEFKVVVYNRGRRILRTQPTTGKADIFALSADLTEDIERCNLIVHVILDAIWHGEADSPLPNHWLPLVRLPFLKRALTFHQGDDDDATTSSTKSSKSNERQQDNSNIKELTIKKPKVARVSASKSVVAFPKLWDTPSTLQPELKPEAAPPRPPREYIPREGKFVDTLALKHMDGHDRRVPIIFSTDIQRLICLQHMTAQKLCTLIPNTVIIRTGLHQLSVVYRDSLPDELAVMVREHAHNHRAPLDGQFFNNWYWAHPFAGHVYGHSQAPKNQSEFKRKFNFHLKPKPKKTQSKSNTKDGVSKKRSAEDDIEMLMVDVLQEETTFDDTFEMRTKRPKTTKEPTLGSRWKKLLPVELLAEYQSVNAGKSDWLQKWIASKLNPETITKHGTRMNDGSVESSTWMWMHAFEWTPVYFPLRWPSSANFELRPGAVVVAGNQPHILNEESQYSGNDDSSVEDEHGAKKKPTTAADRVGAKNSKKMIMDAVSEHDPRAALSVACTLGLFIGPHCNPWYSGKSTSNELKQALHSDIVFATKMMGKDAIDRPELSVSIDTDTSSKDDEQSGGRIERIHPTKQPPCAIKIADPYSLFETNVYKHTKFAEKKQMDIQFFATPPPPPALHSH